MKRIALFILFLNLIACGKNSTPPDGFTKINFVSDNKPQGDEKSVQANLVKGMMVYALNTNNGRVAAKYAQNIGSFLVNSKEVFLPNGAYKFFALGYDTISTSAAIIMGDFYCGEGNNGDLVFLNGGNKDVNILLTNANSAECPPAFAAPEHRYNGAIKLLKVQLCAVGNVGPGCTGLGSKSFRFVIGEYDSLFNGPFFNFSNSIKSCHDKASPSVEILNTHFPMRIPFRFKLESFTGAGCVGAPVRSIMFENGMEGTPNNSDRYINNSNANYIEIGIGV